MAALISSEQQQVKYCDGSRYAIFYLNCKSLLEKHHLLYKHWSEIPGELSRANIISSHLDMVKITCYFHKSLQWLHNSLKST